MKQKIILSKWVGTAALTAVIALCPLTAAAAGIELPNTQSKIFLLVDPHGDPGGQRRLAEALMFLRRHEGVRWAFMEAASGDVSLDFLKGTGEAERLRAVAGRYLTAGYLNGSEWASLFDADAGERAEDGIRLWGVENPDLYERTILLYRSVSDARNAALLELRKAREATLLINADMSANSGRAHRREERRLLSRLESDAVRSQIILSDPWKYAESTEVRDTMCTKFYGRLSRGVNQWLSQEHPDRLDLMMSGRAVLDVVSALRTFDEICRQRNREFVGRAVERMEDLELLKAALVVGEIHASQIADLLRARGIACDIVRFQPPGSGISGRYEELLVGQSLERDRRAGEVSPSAPIMRPVATALPNLPQATMLRPMVAQAAVDRMLSRTPVITQFAGAVGPSAERALKARLAETIGEGLLSDRSSDADDENGSDAPSQSKPQADYADFDAFRRHIDDLERLKVSKDDPATFAGAIRRSLQIYAASLQSAASSRSSVTFKPAPGFAAVTERVSRGALNQFLESNVTRRRMPLSYKAPADYWKDPANDSPVKIEGVIERQITANSVNIYDATVWQLALLRGGGDKGRRLSGAFTRRLLKNRSGGLKSIRATDFPFRYGDQREKLAQENAYFFRIISDRYLQPDPRDGQEYMPGFPNGDRLHHEDWKAITGEQAWAGLIGPMQLAYQKYGGFVPADADEVRFATDALIGIRAMQSPIGAIYHAPWGTHGKDARDISNENNFSVLAGLKMLRKVLADNGDTKRSLRIEWMARGIENYMRDYGFDREKGVFYQGGFLINGEFVPNPVFAVDCQTWGAIVMGPDWLDRTFGEGTAYRIWKNTKARAGFYDAAGRLRGVGFTDSRDVVSVEWSAGAILCVRTLAEHYARSRPDWARELAYDDRSMREGMESLKVDTGSGVAYLYANRRFFIPFGWWANPIPSLVATSWMVLLDEGYNPFILGGGVSRHDK